ncbi:MAG TPA: response regulator transcription factor [Steroidobacteraceae bacterium]|jgi:DNA-binding response OmpR family regulator|nr:response regulator transcription factor [Steroidobacteraceae bacterium]
MRVLLVEDDAMLADAIVRGLSLANFAVDHAANARVAEQALASEHFDLAILDLGLPDDDGLNVLGRLRKRGRTIPVLVLTARLTLQDKIRAFDLGADDFVMKPFEQAELAARCNALIRRSNQAPAGAVRVGGAEVDLLGHQLQIDGSPVELTRREWTVLEALAHSLGRVVSKERLVGALSGWDQDLTANAVETHVSRLRSKLGSAASIRTVRGLGYRLEEYRPKEGKDRPS